MPTTAASAPPPAQGLYEILAAAAAWYQEQLKQSPEAIEYLKGRGLSGEIAVQFGIGYAPGGWDGLLKKLGTDDKRVDLLKRAGMLSEGKGGVYDKFRDRIMFPIRDGRGRVIAFGGRAMSPDALAKYLNSPDTPLFHKGTVLYNMDKARKGAHQAGELIACEGYMDVIALAQYGITNAVATLGTATSAAHLEKLYRFCPEVVFCFDGDSAGRQAARRGDVDEAELAGRGIVPVDELVAVQAVAAGRAAGVPERLALEQIGVEVAVAVEVEEGGAGTHDLGGVELAGHAVVVDEVEAPPRRLVDEDRAAGRRWLRGLLRRSLRRRIGTAPGERQDGRREGAEEVQRVDPAGAHDAQDREARGHGEPGGTREVGRGVRAVVAAEGEEDWLVVHGLAFVEARRGDAAVK